MFEQFVVGSTDDKGRPGDGEYEGGSPASLGHRTEPITKFMVGSSLSPFPCGIEGEKGRLPARCPTRC